MTLTDKNRQDMKEKILFYINDMDNKNKTPDELCSRLGITQEEMQELEKNDEIGPELTKARKKLVGEIRDKILNGKINHNAGKIILDKFDYEIVKNIEQKTFEEWLLGSRG